MQNPLEKSGRCYLLNLHVQGYHNLVRELKLQESYEKREANHGPALEREVKITYSNLFSTSSRPE